jgi:hypothetical protein
MPNIQLKTSNTPGVTPTGLVPGELAINTADNAVYIGNAAGATIKIVGTLASLPANSVSITGGSVQGTAIGSSSPSTVSTSNLQIAGGQTVTGVSTSAALGTSNTTLASQSAVVAYANTHTASLKNIITFTGNGTYTKSGTDVRQIRVICVGGGGGARGYGESGGAGGFSERWIDATGISTVSVTIGGGGEGFMYYGYSPSGGTTSFGSFCSASGGNGANNNQDHTGGQGGNGSGGELNFQGGGGVGHHNCHTSSHHNPGMGGASFFGGAQPGVHYTSRSDSVGAFGAGGTGSNWYNNGANFYDKGFDGLSGVCIVYEYR